MAGTHSTYQAVLGTWDYLVLAAMLAVSASIGIYYRFSGNEYQIFLRGHTLSTTATQGEGGVGELQSVLVTVMSSFLVTMTSFCSQRGEGVKKGQ